MVNFQQLKGITQSNAQTAQLQALQTAVAGELDTRAAKMRLLGEVIPSSLAFGDKLLDRRAEAKAAKAKQLALQGYNDAQIDLMLGSQLGGIGDPGYEGQAPLELKSYPLDEVADANRIQQTEPGKFSVGIDNGQAMATPGINPQIEASMRRIAKYGGLAGIPQGDIRASLAYSQYSPEGLKDRYSAEEAKSEYLSKEGLEGAGSKSRRNLDRDLDLSKTRADIDNIRDTINKRTKGGSGTSSQDDLNFKVTSLMNSVADELKIINNGTDLSGRFGAFTKSQLRQDDALGNIIVALANVKKTIAAGLRPLVEKGKMTNEDVQAMIDALPVPWNQTNAQQQQQWSTTANMFNRLMGDDLLDVNLNVSGQVINKQGQASGNNQSGSSSMMDKRSIFKRIDELEKKARK